MASFNVILKPSVQKDLRPIPKVTLDRIWGALEALQQEPLPMGHVKLSGSEGLYRIRVGDYRVIYSIDHDSRSILIQYVRHRKEAYRSL